MWRFLSPVIQSSSHPNSHALPPTFRNNAQSVLGSNMEILMLGVPVDRGPYLYPTMVGKICIGSIPKEEQTVVRYPTCFGCLFPCYFLWVCHSKSHESPQAPWSKDVSRPMANSSAGPWIPKMDSKDVSRPMDSKDVSRPSRCDSKACACML